MFAKIMIPVFCHLLGDYVLQSNFVSVGKAASWYLLLVHCVLYILPFYIAFGLDARIYALFVSHFLIDMYDRWGKSNELIDQIGHYSIMAYLYVM